MENFLEEIDMYGTRFSFRTKSRESYKTKLGGLFTILTITIIGLFSFFFGQDFYYGTNPTIYTNTLIPEKYDPPLNLTPENFVIAWRIENFQKVFTDVSGIIYAKTFHFRLRRDSKGNMELISNEEMKQVKCNVKNAQVAEFTNSNKITDWFCYDWTSLNYKFGGFFDGDYVDAFQTVLYVCKDGIDYDASNKDCTKLEDYQAFDTKNGGLVMSIMYPEFYFSADDLQKPLKLVYKNFFYYFNIKSQKIDRLFFNKISIRDDQGWIFEDTKESSLLSFSRIQSDLNFAQIENGSISRFYEFNLYMEKKSIVIKRSFMKIQDVSAKVGGLIKIVMTLFAVCNSIFNFHSFQMEVFKELFVFPLKDLMGSNNPKERLRNKMNLVNPSIFKMNMSNAVFKNLNDKNKISNYSNNNNEKLSFFRQKIMINPKFKINEDNENSENRIFAKGENAAVFKHLMDKNNLKSKCENVQIKEKISNSSEKQIADNIIKNSYKPTSGFNADSPNAEFGFSFKISKCFGDYSSALVKRKMKAYDFLINFFNKRLDLIFYFKSINKNDLVHSLILSELQNKALNYVEKPNIFVKQQINIYEKQVDDTKEIDEIIMGYKSKIEGNAMDANDQKLLLLLPEKIQNEILI